MHLYILRIPPNYRDLPSGCLPLGILPDNEKSTEDDKEILKKNERKGNNDNFQRKLNRKLINKKLRKDLEIEKILIDDTNVFKNNTSVMSSTRIITGGEVEKGNFPVLILDKKFSHFESKKMKKNAEKLFKEVDNNWEKMDCDRLLWWHHLSIKNALYPYMPWFLKKKNNGIF